MVNFGSKIHFLECKYQGWKKKYPEKCFFGIKLLFFEKKFFVCKIFVIFEFFLKSEAWLQNLRLVHDFSEFSGHFDTYIGPGSAFV